MKVKRKPSQIIVDIVENTSFFRIFLTWFILILLFGIAYFGLTNYSEGNFLFDSRGFKINNLVESIYYSFITATSTGYGDIVPMGLFTRLIAVGEVIIGLLMLAVVTSKLVSLKQEKLLEEIFHLSFSDKFNRILSNFHMFGHQMEEFIYSLNKRILDKKNILTFSHHITLLKNNIDDVHKLFFHTHSEKISRKLDTHQIEHLLNSYKKSLGGIIKALKITKNHTMVFKRKSISHKLKSICESSEEVIQKINRSHKHHSKYTKSIMSKLREIRAHLLDLNLNNIKLLTNINGFSTPQSLIEEE